MAQASEVTFAVPRRQHDKKSCPGRSAGRHGRSGRMDLQTQSDGSSVQTQRGAKRWEAWRSRGLCVGGGHVAQRCQRNEKIAGLLQLDASQLNDKLDSSLNTFPVAANGELVDAFPVTAVNTNITGFSLPLPCP